MISTALIGVLWFVIVLFFAPVQRQYYLTSGFSIQTYSNYRVCHWNHNSKMRLNPNPANDWVIDDDNDDDSNSSYDRNGAALDKSDGTNGSERKDIHDNVKSDEEIYIQDEYIRCYFATCIPGLNNALASELISLGAGDVESRGRSGVSFTGSPTIGLKSILWCRTAHRIMELIASSTDSSLGFGYDDYSYDNGFSQGLRNSDDLYRFVKTSIHTPTLLGDGKNGLNTLSVSTIYSSRVPKELCHGHFTALTVKNALVDSVREMREDGSRPDIDVEDPDVPLIAVLRGRRLDSYNRNRNTRFRRGSEYETGRNHDSGNEEDQLVADVDIYRCLHSGGSLHRRGYRTENVLIDDVQDDEVYLNDSKVGVNPLSQDTTSNTPIHKAAMKETLAAGLLIEAGWDKLVQAARSDGCGAVLIDPMTGSGTLPTEAALMACDMAPGLSRIASWRDTGRNPHRFPPAVRWKDFCSIAGWNDLLADAAQRAKKGMQWAHSSSKVDGKNNISILSNEKNLRALNLAKISIQNSGVRSIITLQKGDCLDWILDEDGSGAVIKGRTMIVCNPPWGVRLTNDIDESWVSLREFLRREGSGAEAWVLSGNKDLTKILRMKKSRSVVVRTAEEDLRWLQYHIFKKDLESAPVSMDLQV